MSHHVGVLRTVKLTQLVGSGDKIGLVTAPIAVVGLIANIVNPSFFSVGGPPDPWRLVSVVVLIPGLVVWLWSAILILTRVPRHELITSGPYAVVRHPLYTSVALLVLPWAGFLLDTWLGLLIGVVLYAASRLFAPQEDAALATTFGSAWRRYEEGVLIPWL
jgi:protein-S-isoprenylcysteine O-methyltransferase Ste14